MVHTEDFFETCNGYKLYTVLAQVNACNANTYVTYHVNDLLWEIMRIQACTWQIQQYDLKVDIKCLRASRAALLHGVDQQWVFYIFFIANFCQEIRLDDLYQYIQDPAIAPWKKKYVRQKRCIRRKSVLTTVSSVRYFIDNTSLVYSQKSLYLPSILVSNISYLSSSSSLYSLDGMRLVDWNSLRIGLIEPAPWVFNTSNRIL